VRNVGGKPHKKTLPEEIDVHEHSVSRMPALFRTLGKMAMFLKI